MLHSSYMLTLLFKANQSGILGLIVIMLVVFSWIAAAIIYKIIDDKNAVIQFMKCREQKEVLKKINVLENHINDILLLLAGSKGYKKLKQEATYG